MTYFFIAGETSGDLHASNLMKAIKWQDPNATFFFMGGDKMQSVANVPPIVHCKDIAFMGFINVIKNIRKIKQVASTIQHALQEIKPDIIIPVDYGSFCFKYILPFAKQYLPQTPIAYYIAPKVWAWKSWRLKTIKKYVDILLCILPFEEDYFKKHGINAYFVGNPCVDALREYNSNSLYDNLISKYHMNQKQIALLPGSRIQEIEANLKVMLDSLCVDFGGWNIMIACSSSIPQEVYNKIVQDRNYRDVNIHLQYNSTYDILSHSKLAIVTSGTATLETALLGIPQIVVYRMGGYRLARYIFKYFFPIKYISLVNLMINKSVVKELIGDKVNIREIQSEIQKILTNDNYRLSMLGAYQELRELLINKDASSEAATKIKEILLK